jgi:ABC-type phosphate transport system substrate-binding protein
MCSDIMAHYARLIRLAVCMALGAALLSPISAFADLVVVVNPQSGVEQLTKSQAINIFLGRHRELPNGLAASPVDLPATSQEKGLFYQLLVHKDLDQMAAYWSRLVFAGSTAPPMQATTVQEAIQFVANNRSGVAYIDRRNVDARVKIVLTLE